jgi:hypothetical protein
VAVDNNLQPVIERAWRRKVLDSKLVIVPAGVSTVTGPVVAWLGTTAEHTTGWLMCPFETLFAIAGFSSMPARGDPPARLAPDSVRALHWIIKQKLKDVTKILQDSTMPP